MIKAKSIWRSAATSPRSAFDVVAPDGTVRCSIKALFTGKMITVDDPSATILPGDELRHRLPNGTEEAFEVVDPKFLRDTAAQSLLITKWM
jgi:hypothetical protein